MQVDTQQETTNVSRSEPPEPVINEIRGTRYMCITFLPFENSICMKQYSKKDLVLIKE